MMTIIYNRPAFAKASAPKAGTWSINSGGASEVKHAGHSETFTSGKLPQKTTIVVLKSTE